MLRELPEFKSLCQSPWKLVAKYSVCSSHAAEVIRAGLGGGLRDLNCGLKQMDRFTLTSALPDDKHMKEQERVGSIWIAIFA